MNSNFIHCVDYWGKQVYNQHFLHRPWLAAGPLIMLLASLMVSGWIKNQDSNQWGERWHRVHPSHYYTCYDRSWHLGLTALSHYRDISQEEICTFSIHWFEGGGLLKLVPFLKVAYLTVRLFSQTELHLMSLYEMRWILPTWPHWVWQGGWIVVSDIEMSNIHLASLTHSHLVISLISIWSQGNVFIRVQTHSIPRL